MKRSSILMALCVMGISITSCKKEHDVTKNNAAESLAAVQGYSCVYTIKTSQTVVDASTLNLPAGSVVCIEAGTRGPLWLKNFQGEAGKPITFVNSNGKVSINASSSNGYGLKFSNCKYVKVAGNGSNDQYGIHVNGSHIGVTFESLSTNWEISNVEISNIGFAGLMGKTDPTCDPSTWNGNFVMRDCSIHDNYVHDVTGEGFYVGNSFYASGRALSCGTITPHTVEGLRLYKNKVVNSGCEGIQVGCATKGCEIFDNTIENFGKDPFAANQNNGLQLGEGTGGKCYNNIIKNGPGNGIICLGYGDNVVYNNVVLNAGAYGVYCDTRYTPGPAFSFINNTIINSGSDGFMIAAGKIAMNNVINNIIVNPKTGKYINTRNSAKVTDKNNYTSMNIADVKFVNASGGDYRLAAGSPAIDKGADVSSFGVTYDLSNTARPTGGTYDVGAYEGTSSGTSVPNPGTGTGGGTTTPTDPGTGGGTTTPTPGVTKVTSVTLVNADTDKDIMTLSNGAVIDYSKIGTKNINVRANVASGFAGSVQFKLDGAVASTESSVPLTLFGDAGTDYKPGTFTAGSHKLTVTDYSSASAQGTVGGTTEISFTVTNGEVTTPTPSTGNSVVSFILINSETNKEIATITNGATISLSALKTSKINIKANTGSEVKSVAFKMDGKSGRIESEAPYSIGGDTKGDYQAYYLALGNHTVSATPYTQAGTKGTAGTTLSVNFNLVK
ncbi:MAG: right-handed parallel beta-helix repeat-containing protein [Sporocytophaga sp.]|uniref:right-handed parallel beta-helix repeat-containing protein n=1 Tax=Sporocytophaga sp. TaxID=2231183 RepID=UPI001B155F46|nr:right-handed parallel beta-helix repeat-containing protein [Sporocytophaga sp.]MBO9703746.1 right-handed parallel beta-helix repeat-containing protein [Sporocytophaga sp.]